MKEKIEISCMECDADYIVSHELDQHRYEPKKCIFCGEELDTDEIHTFEFDDEEEEWIENE